MRHIEMLIKEHDLCTGVDWLQQKAFLRGDVSLKENTFVRHWSKSSTQGIFNSSSTAIKRSCHHVHRSKAPQMCFIGNVSGFYRTLQLGAPALSRCHMRRWWWLTDRQWTLRSCLEISICWNLLITLTSASPSSCAKILHLCIPTHCRDTPRGLGGWSQTISRWCDMIWCSWVACLCVACWVYCINDTGCQLEASYGGEINIQLLWTFLQRACQLYTKILPNLSNLRYIVL